jgi:ribosomal protein S18 acetylase RimI-like enzyme
VSNQVELIEEAQLAAAADALGRAFFNDPLQMYILPDDGERQRLSAPIFHALLKYGHRNGHVLTTPGDPAGAAVWMKPGEWEMTESGMEEAGFMALPGLLGEDAFNRFGEFFGYIEQYHHRDVPAEHWYLAVIGVDPPHQGKGHGAAMIRPVLAAADETNIPCYLETAQPDNVPLYQHLGFKVLLEEVEPTSGVRFWTFRRDPPA